jgi:coenzyme F420 hydrogenase subunit beta
VCPGVGINLKEQANELFGADNDKRDFYAGSYQKCFTGYSNDYEIRYHCASGGMVSQLLIWLLDQGKIDGAVVTSFDAKSPLLVRSRIATTRSEILEAKSSKYAPVTLNHAIQDIKIAKGTRFVIVGLPCHIEGFRKYEAKDKLFKSKVIGYFGLFCSSGRSFYLTEHVMRERGIDMDKLEYFSYRDNGCLGNMVAKGDSFNFEERFQDYYHPLRSIFVPKRCIQCIDHYSELADVSFGDIHIQPYIQDKVGISSVIVRNKLFGDWIYEAKNDGTITLDEISIDLLNASQPMSKVKKTRNVAFVKIKKCIGKKVPNYGDDISSMITIRWLISYAQTSLQQLVGRYKSLWFLIGLLKGKAPKE